LLALHPCMGAYSAGRLVYAISAPITGRERE
jgi:hypothetical protein